MVIKLSEFCIVWKKNWVFEYFEFYEDITKLSRKDGRGDIKTKSPVGAQKKIAKKY